MKRPVASTPRYRPETAIDELLHWTCIGGAVGLACVFFFRL